MDIDPGSFNLGISVGIGVILIIYIILALLRPWRHAFFSGAPVPLAHIIGMRLRGNPPSLIIDAYIQLLKREINVPIGAVEVMYIDHKNTITTSDMLAKLTEEKFTDKGNSPTRQSKGTENPGKNLTG